MAAAVAKNADGASTTTLRIPSPPSLIGRLAWIRAVSSIAQLVTFETPEQSRLLNLTNKCCSAHVHQSGAAKRRPKNQQSVLRGQQLYTPDHSLELKASLLKDPVHTRTCTERCTQEMHLFWVHERESPDDQVVIKNWIWWRRSQMSDQDWASQINGLLHLV